MKFMRLGDVIRGGKACGLSPLVMAGGGRLCFVHFSIDLGFGVLLQDEIVVYLGVELWVNYFLCCVS